MFFLYCTSKLALLFNSSCNYYNNKYLLLLVNGTISSQYFIFKLTLLLVLSCNVGSPLAENFSGYTDLLHKKLQRSESSGQHRVSTLFHLFSSLQFFTSLVEDIWLWSIFDQEICFKGHAKKLFQSRQNMYTLNFISDVNNITCIGQPFSFILN